LSVWNRWVAEAPEAAAVACSAAASKVVMGSPPRVLSVGAVAGELVRVDLNAEAGAGRDPLRLVAEKLAAGGSA
jgi:hypothetical protein